MESIDNKTCPKMKGIKDINMGFYKAPKLENQNARIWDIKQDSNLVKHLNNWNKGVYYEQFYNKSDNK